MGFKSLLAKAGKAIVKQFGNQIEQAVIHAIDKEGDKGQEAAKTAVTKALDKLGK